MIYLCKEYWGSDHRLNLKKCTNIDVLYISQKLYSSSIQICFQIWKIPNKSWFFFLYFQCSKKEEIYKIIDIRRKNLTRFLKIIKCVWNYAAKISSSLKWDTLRAILMCFSMVIEVNEREVFRNRLGEKNANGGLCLL